LNDNILAQVNHYLTRKLTSEILLVHGSVGSRAFMSQRIMFFTEGRQKLRK